MRGLGRLIGKAAAGAAPIALEKWRQDVLAQRDAKLREYDVQDRDVQIANTNEQARLNREQDTSQFNQTAQQRKDEFGATIALDERRTTAAERTATAEQGRIDKLMTQLDIAIDSDKIALEDAKALQSLKQELTKAETPEDQDRILTVIMGRQGKERDPQFSFPEGTSLDPTTGERISTLVRTNSRTGEFEVVLGPGGAGGEGAPESAGMPKVGEVYEGFKFKGGDPNSQDSWEPASAGSSEPAAAPERSGAGLLSQAVPAPKSEPSETRTLPGDVMMDGKPPAQASKADQGSQKKVSYYPSTSAGKSAISGSRGLHSVESMNKAMIELRDAYAKEIKNVGTDSYKAKSLLKEIGDLGKVIADAKG